MRALRPEEYPGSPSGDRAAARTSTARCCTSTSARRACSTAARRSTTSGSRGYAADLWLLGGGLVVGVLGGIGAGVWCVDALALARGPRASSPLAMLAFCTPVYVVGLGLLLLFSPAFGLWHLPYFFDPHSYVSRWRARGAGCARCWCPRSWSARRSAPCACA